MTALTIDVVLNRAEIEPKIDGTAYGVDVGGVFIHTMPGQQEALAEALQMARRGELSWVLSVADTARRTRKALESDVSTLVKAVPLKGTIS